MSQMNLNTFDLTQLPTAEDDNYEFKSSLTKPEELKKKLRCAASAFANSGGGYFVVGVNGQGDADGGIDKKIGRQPLRDWVDNIIHEIQPPPSYEVKLVEDPDSRGTIKAGKAVLVVRIHESFYGPHMAPDGRYYIRAGAHTVTAKHFIVEALWAKRNVRKPRLTHLFRLKPGYDSVRQLGVLALTDAPAINVSIQLNPLPQYYIQNRSFPLKVPVVDSNNPFFFDMDFLLLELEKENNKLRDKMFMEVKYSDLSGNDCDPYKSPVKITDGIPPDLLGNDYPAKIVKELQSINNTLSKIIVSREAVVKPSILLSKNSASIFPKLERQIPELLESLREVLRESPFVREFVILSKNWDYNNDPNNTIFKLYFENHDLLRQKLRMLENYGLIYEITFNQGQRFVLSEDLVEYLCSNFW